MALVYPRVEWVGASVLAAGLLSSCAGQRESAAWNELRELPHPPAKLAEAEVPPIEAEAGLSAYVALALKHSPAIQASFERWQGSVYRISRARRLPEPMLGFDYLIRTAESPIAPNQARIGLQQAFPWPTKLTAGADAASAEARALQAEFEARALEVSRRVADAYWELWVIRRARAIHREHLDVVRGLSASARARIATGGAMLAELHQIDLTAARVEDTILGMDEDEKAAEARLRQEVGASTLIAVPTAHPPPPIALPAERYETLVDAARAHPLIAKTELMAESFDSAARAEAADRWPSFTVGVGWMITGSRDMPGGVDLGAAISLPLWQGSYADAISAREADASAQRAEGRVLLDRARAALESALSRVRDAVRRAALYQDTLVPQAESAYESVLGAYTVGQGTVAQALLAQRDLLDLRVELDRARADHARAWARLEEVAGRELRRSPVVGDHHE